jgi:hypothetical protein
LRPPFRSKQEVIIHAPLEAVWSFSMDLTKIPEFHSSVFKVDLIDGKSFREPGVSYQCHLSGGKHTCIEKDIEIVPLQKIVTVLPEDTFDISGILSDYTVETMFRKFEKEESVLRRMGLDFEVLDSGCCGMAGAFGYEDDKYEVAQAIGERVLLPRVRDASATTLIIANGFSCREQIAQSTTRSALHLAEVIQLAERHGVSGPGTGSPERITVEKRKRMERRARASAGAFVAVALLGCFVFYRRLAR